jgi:hypothetical protein
MVELGVFDRGWGNQKWCRPMWYEIIQMHIKQIVEVMLNQDKAREESYGIKKYLRST